MNPQDEKLKANLIQAYNLEMALTSKLCLDSLKHFTKTFWDVIEPGTQYHDGWHIDVICKHLEAAARFELEELIVNCPPRHMKSILCSVMFPAWVWAHEEWAHLRFMTASYANSLSVRDGIKMRDIIQSPLYQKLFKPTWHMSHDQNQKLKFENTRKGFRFSTSVGGAAIGEGGDFLILDDSIKPIDATSDQIRDETNRWVDTSWSTRANNPERHCKIYIMQRLHENDTVGHIKAKKRAPSKKRAHLVLQARFDSNSKVKSESPITFTDPRFLDGQPLWPEHFNEAALQNLESDLEGDAHAQLQQDPKPKSGGTFKRDWWQLFEAPPSAIISTVQFIDAAQKPGISNDYSVIATIAKTQNGFYWLDLWRDKVDMPTLEEIVKSQYDLYKPDAVVIEDKSGGSSLIQYLLYSTTMPVIPYDPQGQDKEIRAMAATPTVRAKRCHLPKYATWLETFLNEHEKFPKASNDDQVDTTSMMVSHWVRRGISEPRVRSL